MDASLREWDTAFGIAPPQYCYQPDTQPGLQAQPDWVHTPPPRVILVDDDGDLLDLLRQVFESDGYRVALCRTLEDAVSALRHEPADLVVTDARLRDHAEFVVPRWLDEHRPPLHGIIILTGVGANTLRQHDALIHRLDAHVVTKPFEVDGLLGVARGLTGWPGLA